MERLKQIKDRSEIMSVLLSKSTAYWNYIDKILKYPLIISSSGLVIVNSYFKDTDTDINLYNVIFDGINVVFMGIINNLDLTKKIENLKSKSTEFYELVHNIEADIMTNNVSIERIISIQDKYDMIMNYTEVGSIPESIKRKVRKDYEGKKTMPLLLNGLLDSSLLKAVSSENV